MGPKTLVFLALFIVQVSCQYKNSLTFVIDDTRSMGGELAEVKKAAKSIVDVVLNETASQIEDIVLVTFNDPGVKFWNRTRDADVFKHALDQVQIHDGYCSEMSLNGTKLALEESLPGSYLFVFTDAGANDLHLLEQVILLCQEKQSQIVFVLTGEICQTTAEYYRIARACNGQVFKISKEQIGQVIEYVKETIKGDRSVITNQVAPPLNLTNVKFYIDDKTEYAIVSASGDRVFLKIKDHLNRNLLSGYSWIMRTANVKVLKLAHLRTGAYVAQVYGTTDVNVMVFARTDFTFEYGFSDYQEHSLSTSETQPTIGTPTHLMILVRDEKNSVAVQEVQILDMNENVIANQSLNNMGGKVYATGQFVPPEQTFKVAVTAIGRSSRRPLRRIAKTPVTPIRPVTVSPEIIDSETYLRKIEGSSVDLPCRIRKGKPKPSITWFFKKKGTTDYVQMRDATNEVLHLINVLVDNDGHYKCVAENTVGRAEHIVRLEVEVAPTIADSETYLQEREGSTVDIGCRIQQGNPTPNIRWFFMKNGTTDFVHMRDATDEVLHLTNVLIDNDGHYKCEAENTVGRAEHIVQLEVEVAPKIADSETYLKKREGSTVDIGCRIQQGNPTPNIRWFFMKKGTTYYVQMRDATDEVLHLTNVLGDNDGHYKCEAENTVGRAEHIVRLEVEVAPTIADSETYLQEREGSTVDIGCRIQQGNPTPNIRWFFMKNGTTDFVHMRDATDEVLHLTNVLMDNDGHYKCEAENAVGRAEHIVQLEVEVTPKIADSETYLKKREGSTVDIGCRIQQGNPTPNIRWFFMKKGTTVYVQMRDATDEVLHLTNVLGDNDGHYKCEAENTVGRAEHIVQLEVEVAPKIADSETYLKSREGSTVDISCRIQEGNPMPNITWWFRSNSGILFVQMRDATNEVLRLTNVLGDNEGYYRCLAENTVGRAVHSVQFEVEVGPKISDSEIYFKKIRGSSLDIPCRILQGKPQPQITWFFKQQGATEFELLRDETQHFHRLPFIDLDNAGDYKCVAENVVNRAEHIVQLEVEVPARILFYSPNQQKYRGVEGDIVMKLSCTAEGHPKPIISWTIDSNTIGTDKSSQSYVEDGSLFVKNPTSANSNHTYVCFATNSVSQHRQTYEVLISEFEDYNQPEKMYGVIGKPYEINCSLPFTDPDSVRWFYNAVYLNVTGASIRWESASQANDGNYTCRVSDLSGAASATVELTFGSPPTPSTSETVFDVDWDDMLQVACMADLNMIGTYEWYRNGERIIDANERELKIYEFGFGNYTCRAVNPMGSLNITYNIPSQDCLIDKNLWTTKKMPVIMDNTQAWPTFSHNQKFVVVPQSEKLHLICQDDPPGGELVPSYSLINGFTKFPSIRSIEPTCDHEDTFLVDGVSQKISELDCILPVTPRVVPSGKQCLGETTQMIDVGFYVDDLIKVYSACLDTNRELLLYTTVTMKGTDTLWEAREPERPCKQVADCCYETIELVNAEDVGFGAAEWATLKDPRNSVFYCRPSEDTVTSTELRSEAAESSPRPRAYTTEKLPDWRSTTEAPPDPETSWHDIEREVRNGPRMTVWSGAGNYTRVGNMMVPQYLWKVVKNLDDDMTVAIVHSNTQAAIPKLCADDCRSPSVLALFEPRGFRTYCCSLDEFKTAFNLPIPF